MRDDPPKTHTDGAADLMGNPPGVRAGAWVMHAYIYTLYTAYTVIYRCIINIIVMNIYIYIYIYIS